jgi:N-acyl amino acid synthase of PEP-CTERM/exosortase system
MATAANLTDLYGHYFEVVPARTPEQLKQAYRLRFLVYCVENTFEDRTEFPDGLERDHYDDHALHSLLIHRPTGAVAGTVRLILAAPSEGRLDLPLERLVQPTPAFPPGIAEISRFAISKDFRRRQTDGLYPDELAGEASAPPAESDARLIPTMALGLMRAIVQMTAEAGASHWCAVMMPALLRLLSRFGIHFHPIGRLIQYRGKRQPCHRDADELLQQIRAECPEIWEFLTDGGNVYPRRQAPYPPARPGPAAVSPWPTSRPS